MATNGIPIGSGIEYPTVEIEGRKYPVVFGRRAFYTLDKRGFDMTALNFGDWLPHRDHRPDCPHSAERMSTECDCPEIKGKMRYHVILDVLHACIGKDLRCETPEDLADLVAPDRTFEIGCLLIASYAKVWLPTRIPQTAATQPTPGEKVQ